MKPAVIPARLFLPALGLRNPKNARLSVNVTLWVFSAVAETWAVASEPSWVETSQSPPGIASHVTPFEFSVQSNEGTDREGEIMMSAAAQLCVSALEQPGGEWVLRQLADLFATTQYEPLPPRWKFPLVMEFGVLARFLGLQISKLPPPAQLAATVAAEGMIVAAGAAAVVARSAFTTVPEPPNYFEQSPVPLTTQLIQQQVQQMIFYLVEEVANRGQ